MPVQSIVFGRTRKASMCVGGFASVRSGKCTSPDGKGFGVGGGPMVQPVLLLWKSCQAGTQKLKLGSSH